MDTICNNCKYNQGKEEYEENKIGLFCCHPEINDYVDTMIIKCSLKIENNESNSNNNRTIKETH